MGTLYTRWAGFEQTAAHTTPLPLNCNTNQRVKLAEVVMEVLTLWYRDE